MRADTIFLLVVLFLPIPVSMGPRRIRRALGAVKDQTSIGMAKLGGGCSSFSAIGIAIVKATRHDEYPADEKHLHHIISLTRYSRPCVTACVDTLSRRLSKTKNWMVALKTLILVHRLLSRGDSSYQNEIFSSTRRGGRFLNMSGFCDTSASSSWDFSAFVRTFALYLDEHLEYRMHDRRFTRNSLGFIDSGGDTNCTSVSLHDMRIEQIFSRIQSLQLLLERFLACRPTGAAKHHRVVTAALSAILDESFRIYYDTAETLVTLIDRFIDLDLHHCTRIYRIFFRVGTRFDELDRFYRWLRSTGIGRHCEYPEVERITQRKLDVMDELIRDKSELVNSRENDGGEDDRESEDVGWNGELGQKDDEFRKMEEKEADLIDLGEVGEDSVAVEEQGETTMVLGLFPSESSTIASDVFSDSDDWETALVKSASSLSKQRASMGGGCLDMVMVDEMYSRRGSGEGGGREMRAVQTVDPFAASSAVAPPVCVQMWEMEKKLAVMEEEQLVWKQYMRMGRPGELLLL